MYEHQRYSGLSKTRNAYCWEGLELSSGTSFAANIVEPNRVNQNCFQQSATDPAKEAHKFRIPPGWWLAENTIWKRNFLLIHNLLQDSLLLYEALGHIQIPQMRKISKNEHLRISKQVIDPSQCTIEAQHRSTWNRST